MAPADARRVTVRLIVSVDWEGRVITEENLSAMEGFRSRFPDIPITHFLNAAYYTKPGADAQQVTASIARTVRPGDERGLHIHGWKRLFEAAGVTFREGPTFWGTPRTRGDCSADCGHDVPISEYSTDELRRVLRFSVATLEREGFGRAQSFRAGGWMATPAVRDALTAEGFARDSSAVATELLANEIGARPLWQWLKDLWPTAGLASQPFDIPTRNGVLIENVDNGALADYVTAEEVLDVYRACRDAARERPDGSAVMNIGFHQETAAQHLPELSRGIERVLEQARRDGVSVEPVTTAALGGQRRP